MSERLSDVAREDLRNREKSGFENALRGLLATERLPNKVVEVVDLIRKESAAFSADGDAAWMLRYGKVLHSASARLDARPEEEALAELGKHMISLGKEGGSREDLLRVLDSVTPVSA
jgi:hypothetical protein